MSDAKPKTKRKRINVRRPDVMEKVQAEVQRHYESSIVEKIRANDGSLTIGNTTIKLARQFGFCYGVERAIDLAYAARKVFADNNIFLIGEIIHNQEVNRQLEEMKIVSLPWKEMNEQYDQLTQDDVVIVPAFGAPTSYIEKIEERGAAIVDTTCGDVMKVWRRVRNYAKEGYTSIIHGKAGHEETRATASRALGDNKDGHYIVILTLEDTDFLCSYLNGKITSEALMERFGNAVSPGFDPEIHLHKVGVANQTTMLKSETEEIQRRVCKAINERDGKTENFQFFDTICGATQERQDALFDMLKEHMDILLVVGGYNSSNTSHLVEIGQEELPTFFIQNSDRLKSLKEIVHFDLEQKSEVNSEYNNLLDLESPVTIGITAGASCPNNLIEATIQRVFELRGISANEI
ncbi:4-hydroxy-3-methylbut-2-enyl diphosphate reductase [Rubritalea tangerina]|uniref:4-hydroxy-3-methylbut-2-enyl diphosphate reductase n=2 Tax=Rubritalea tangerina TaxID=430798 RepID=A0ABW4ZD57_9BACT